MIIRSFFFALLGSLVLASCNEGDSDSDFPSSTGIQGRVVTQNEFQQPLYEERAGVEMLLEVGFREFPVDADIVGQWQLGGAPVGTYTFTIEKDGFGTIKERGIRISTVNPEYPVEEGFQRIPTFFLTKLPTTQFEDVMLDLSFETVEVGMTTDTIWNLDLTAMMNPAPPPTGQPKGYRVFLGTDNLLSKENYLFQQHYTSTSAEIALNYNDAFFDSLNIR